MAEKKHNVTIVVRDNRVHPDPEGVYYIHPLVKFDNEQLKKYMWETEGKLKNFVSKCTPLINFKHVVNSHFLLFGAKDNPFWRQSNLIDDDSLQIEIVSDPKCNLCGHDCPQNIKTGKCKDACVAEIIGKTFFPDRYIQR